MSNFDVKKKITIALSKKVIEFFKEESVRTGIPYQVLINYYLVECAGRGVHLDMRNSISERIR